MSLREKTEPALQSSNLGYDASFATPSKATQLIFVVL
jgi:hypothetical protein